MQVVIAAPSIEQTKVLSGSVLWNTKVAEVAPVNRPGIEVIWVSGGMVSTVHVAVAGVSSTTPCRSVAATAKVCGPSSRAS